MNDKLRRDRNVFLLLALVAAPLMILTLPLPLLDSVAARAAAERIARVQAERRAAIGGTAAQSQKEANDEETSQR